MFACKLFSAWMYFTVARHKFIFSEKRWRERDPFDPGWVGRQGKGSGNKGVAPGRRSFFNSASISSSGPF